MTINIARTFALSVASAGIVGAAALGLAGTAGATTTTHPTVPSFSHGPVVKAHPAPQAMPGWQGHHGANRIQHFVPGYHR